MFVNEEGPQACGEAKHLVERDGDKVGRTVLQVEGGAADVRGCIEQHKPAAPVGARRVELSRMDALDIAKGILLPGKVALGRVAEEMWCLAGVIFTANLIFGPALHFLWGDGQGDYPPAGRQSSNTYNRGMAVGEIAEVAPRLSLHLRPPREAISHHSDSSCATGGENHRVLLRGCVEMLQYPAR